MLMCNYVHCLVLKVTRVCTFIKGVESEYFPNGSKTPPPPRAPTPAILYYMYYSTKDQVNNESKQNMIN